MGGEAELGDLRQPVTRRLAALALVLLAARWIVLKLASYAGHRRGPGPAPLDSERPPGWMPLRRSP